MSSGTYFSQYGLDSVGPFQRTSTEYPQGGRTYSGRMFGHPTNGHGVGLSGPEQAFMHWSNFDSGRVDISNDEESLLKHFDKLRELDTRIDQLEQAIQEEDNIGESGVKRVYDRKTNDTGKQRDSGIIYRVYDESASNAGRKSDTRQASHVSSFLDGPKISSFRGSDGNIQNGFSSHQNFEDFGSYYRDHALNVDGVRDQPMLVDELNSNSYRESGTQTSPKKDTPVTATNDTNGDGHLYRYKDWDERTDSDGSSRSSRDGHNVLKLNRRRVRKTHRRQSNVGLNLSDTVEAREQVPTIAPPKLDGESSSFSLHGPHRLHVVPSNSPMIDPGFKGASATQCLPHHHNSMSFSKNWAHGKDLNDQVEKTSLNWNQSGIHMHTSSPTEKQLAYLPLETSSKARSQIGDHSRSLTHNTKVKVEHDAMSRTHSKRPFESRRLVGHNSQWNNSVVDTSFDVSSLLHEVVGYPGDTQGYLEPSSSPTRSPDQMEFLRGSHLRSMSRQRRRSVDSFIGQLDLNSSVMTFASFRSVDLDESVVYADNQCSEQWDERPDLNHFYNVQQGVLKLSNSTNGHSSYLTHSMSATLWPFKLLELLHHSNPEESQELILKARVFRKWHYQAQLSKSNNARQVKLEQRAVHHRHLSLLFKYWKHWRTRADNGHKSVMADQVYQRQLLRKGLHGLMWARARTQHLIDQVHTISRTSTLRGFFLFWKIKTEKRQQHLLFVSFRRWQHFKLQSERKRMLSTLSLRHVMSKWFGLWKERHQACQQEDIAILHYKVSVLTKLWQAWRLYTRQSAVFAKEKEVAVVHYEHVIQRRALLRMKQMYIKYQCAKIFWRRNELKRAFKLWQQETAMLKVEHMHEVQRSNAIYSRTVLQSTFRRWRMTYSEHHYCRLRDARMCSRVLEIWSLRYRRNVLRRAMKQARHERQTKYTMFITWLQITKLAKEARHSATALLERALLRGVVHSWKEFTQYKIQLGIRQQQHMIRSSQQSKKYFFKVWLYQLRRLSNLREAKRLWSLRCVRNAVDCWREAVRLKKLDMLLESHQPRARYFTVLVAWKTWVHSKHRADWDREKAVGFQRSQEFKETRLIFYRWRLQSQQSLLAAPLRNKTRRRNLGRAFDAWRLVYLRKHSSAMRRHELQHNQLRELFSKWRSKVKKNVGLARLRFGLDRRLLQNCLHGWQLVVNRRKLCDLFTVRRQKNLSEYIFKTWREKLALGWQLRQLSLEHEEQVFYLLRSTFVAWQEKVHRTKVEEDKIVSDIIASHQQRSLSYWFLLWRSRVVMEVKARQLCVVFDRQRLQRLFHAWQTSTTDEVYNSIRRFNEALQARSPSHLGEFMNSLSLPPSPVPLSARSQLSGMLTNRDLSFNPDTFLDLHEDDGYFNQYSTPRTLRPRLERRDSETTVGTSVCSLNLDSLESSGNFHAVQTPLTPFGIQGNDLQDLAMYAICRWRHWPVSAAFHQWREFTWKQRNMKFASDCVKEMTQVLSKRRSFMNWWKQYRDAEIATQFQCKSLLSNSLKLWLAFVYQEKQFRCAKQIAAQHHQSTVQSQTFYRWKLKIAERRRLEELHGVWYDLPVERYYLRDMCERFQEGISCVTTANCWALWRMKLTQWREARLYRDGKLKARIFSCLKNYCQARSESSKLSMQFRCSKLQGRFFFEWKHRQQRQEEADMRFVLSWRRYMVDILKRWKTWAFEHRRETEISCHLERVQSRSLLAFTFYSWREQHRKQQLAKNVASSSLVMRTFRGWYRVSSSRTRCRRLYHQWQVSSCNCLLNTSFHLWQASAKVRQLTRQSNQRRLEGIVRKAALKWRDFTLNRRAQRHWMMESLTKMFLMWRSRVEYQRQTKCVALYFGLLWKQKARNCRLREVEAEDLRRQLNDRVLRIRFDEWVTRWQQLRRSCDHYDSCMKERTFKGWFAYVAKRRHLHAIQTSVCQQKDLAIVSKVFQRWRSELTKCLHLESIASNHLAEHQISIKHEVLVGWHGWCLEQRAERQHAAVLMRKVARAWHLWVCVSTNRKQTMQRFQQELSTNALCRAFRLWQQRLALQRHVTSFASTKLLQRSLTAWKSGCYRQKLLRSMQVRFSQSVSTSHVTYWFHQWKMRHDRHMQMEEEVGNMIGRCNFKLLQVVFYSWRDSARERMALSVYTKNVLRSSLKRWREAMDQKYLDCSLTEMAESHHDNKICLLVLRAWRDEVTVAKMAAKRLKRIVRTFALRWFKYTKDSKIALKMSQYRVYSQVWRAWTTQAIRLQVSRSVHVHFSRTSMAEIFHAWHHLVVIKRNGRDQLESINVKLKTNSFKKWKQQC